MRVCDDVCIFSLMCSVWNAVASGIPLHSIMGRHCEGKTILHSQMMMMMMFMLIGRCSTQPCQLVLVVLVSVGDSGIAHHASDSETCQSVL